MDWLDVLGLDWSGPWRRHSTIFFCKLSARSGELKPHGSPCKPALRRYSTDQPQHYLDVIAHVYILILKISPVRSSSFKTFGLCICKSTA